MLNKILKGIYPKVLQLKLQERDLTDPVKLEEAATKLDVAYVTNIPFGFRVRRAITKDLRSTPAKFRNFAKHNEDVFKHITTLFDNLSGLRRETGDEGLGTTPLVRERLRLAAFLHDVGKALDFARHPTLGWHVLFDLAFVGSSDSESRKLLIEDLKKAKFANPDEEYRKLACFVRDHDKFGVISTGEASYVILGSLVSFGRNANQRSLEQLRDTWLLNIADIAGTEEAKPKPHQRGKDPLADKLDLRADKLEALTSDWKKVYGVLKDPLDSNKDRSYAEILKGLRELSETPEHTVQRVFRLLTERAGNWPGLRDAFSEDLVQEAIDTQLSPKDLLPFCRDFAMVAKLDYALQFWSELADYSYISQILDDARTQRIFEILAKELPNQKERSQGGRMKLPDYVTAYAERNLSRSSWIGLLVDFRKNHELSEVWNKIEEKLTAMDTVPARATAERVARDQAELLVAILRRIVTAYQGLIRGSIASERAAIGVGFSYLRSEGDSEKRFALYELLSGKGAGRERGLRWLIDEIASWEMLA